tara:strand:- start:351 stop:1070 length:720 start_codon:yes stop_codon:yes gene_type:complete
MLSVLIPIRDEYENLDRIESTFREKLKNIDYEVILVNDFSKDRSFEKAIDISNLNNKFKIFNNEQKGLGGAINLGITKSTGDYICIMMADLSDSIEDLKNYYEIIQKKDLDAVFGSRFLKDSKISEYPFKKLILNRIFNNIVKLLFLNSYNDYTNAFKIYKSKVLKSFLPLISESFNIFLEMPLKTISRGYTFEVTPISWINRKTGKAKFNISELRAKYLFTLIYCFIEKTLLKKKKKI